MKKLLFTTGIFLLISIAGPAQPKKFQDIIGRWDIVGEQNAGGALEIIDSSTIILTYMGEKKQIHDYKIDFSKSPFWFDFTTKDTASVVNIKSLMEVVNDTVIKWQLFVDEDRTPHFTASKGEMLYLKKTKRDVPLISRQ